MLNNENTVIENREGETEEIIETGLEAFPGIRIGQTENFSARTLRGWRQAFT